MKTKYSILSNLGLIISLLIVLVQPLSADDTDGYKTISGTAYDSYSNKAISNVIISVKNTNISTNTNTDGFFTLKINSSIPANQLEVSQLGYHNQIVNINEDKNQEVKIFLTPNIHKLKDVTVDISEVSEIVKNAISKIGDNNSNISSMLRGFYRETVQKRGTYISISEAVIDMYKTPYTERVNKDAVQVLKGRTLLSPKLTDTIAVKAQGGPNIAIYMDLAKNKELMLNNEMLALYKFKLEGYASIGDRDHYVISFKPNAITSSALYNGTFYIDKVNLTFSRIELSIDISDRDKATKAVLISKPPKMKFQLNSQNSVITYKQQNGKSYLNYTSSETKFKCNWKKLFYMFAPTYTITCEAVVTDRIEDNVKRMAPKDIFRIRHTLPDKIENFYDPDFWKAYNIIEPTESLESAVNKLIKQTNNK